MATVALDDGCVITGSIPDSQTQRRRDIKDTDGRPDRLQAEKHQSGLELKVFDLGFPAAEKCNSHPGLLSKSTQKSGGQ